MSGVKFVYAPWWNNFWLNFTHLVVELLIVKLPLF